MPSADSEANLKPGQEPGRRTLPWILLLAFIISLILAAAGFVTATERGLQWAFSVLARNIPGELHVDRLEGRLIGPLAIHGLRYTTTKKNIVLSVDKLAADIRPLALLYERVHISQLDISGVNYTHTTNQEPLTALPEIQLPLGITLDQASITNITVTLPGLHQPYPIDRITLKGKTLFGRLHIDSAVLVSRSFQARMRGTLTPQNVYPLNLSMNWSVLPQGYPAITGQTTLTGNIAKKLNIVQSVNAPLKATLYGTVNDILTAVQWQANLTLDKTNLQSIDARWPIINIGGKFHVTTQGGGKDDQNRIIVDGTLQVTHQKYTLHTTARANFSDDKWHIEQATLEIPDKPGRIILKGDLGNGLIPMLDQSTDQPWQLAGHWRDLVWPPNTLPETTVITSKEGNFNLTGNLDAYQFTVDGVVQATARTAEGRVMQERSTNTARGTMPEAASPSGAIFPPTRWSAAGKGNRESLVLDDIRADILKGHITGQGELSWQPQLSWSLDITGSDLDPGQYWPAWPGQLSLQALIHSKEKPSAIAVVINDLHGQLRDIPLKGNASLVIDQDTYAISHLALASGSSQINASGTLNEAWNMQWDVDIKNIHETLPDTRFTHHSDMLKGHGSLTGPRAQPRIRAELQSKNLTLDTYHADEVRFTFDVDMQNQLASQLDLLANGITIGNQSIDNVVVKGRGQVQNHGVDVTLKTNGKTLVLRAEGALGGDIVTPNSTQTASTLWPTSWTGRLTQANMTSQALGYWPLTTPGALTITTDHAQLGPWCWTQQAAQICFDATRTANTGWQGNAHTTNVPINWLQSFLPKDAILAGTFNTTAVAYLNPAGNITGTARFIPSPGAIIHPLANDQNMILAYTQGLIEATLDADTLTARAALTLTDRGTLDGTLLLPRSTLPAFLNSSIPAAQTLPPGAAQIKATLNAEIRELSLLPDFFPEIEDTQGKVNIALTVEGTPNQPRFSGYAKLEQGTALVPRLGLRLHDIQVHVTDTNTAPQGRAEAKGPGSVAEGRTPGATDTSEGQLALTAQARSGNGIVHVRGTLRPDNKQNWGADLTVQGEHFEAIRTPDIQATISPNFTVKVASNTVDINGDLVIPDANIELRDLTTTQRPSSDVVVIRADEKNSNSQNQDQPIINNKRWAINSVIGLKLGDNVKFKGVGLTGRFTGNLALIDTPQQLTTAYGEIRIEDGGEYRAANQKLEVKKGGRLVFAGGPINNPGIDARATRQINANVRVGFNVRGTLQSPKLLVYSDPAMPEADALAYLLFGRPINQTTAAEGSQLTAAATSLGSAGGEFLIKKIGNTLGIEDVRIESSTVASTTSKPSTTQQATVVLGKYLSPKLYITYGVGTIDRINTLRLRYQLSRHWTVEAESGLFQGTDILYTIDKK